MRSKPIRAIERFRIDRGPWSSRQGDRNGMFQVGRMRVLSSDGGGWEHVSVSFPDRCPTWSEMCQVKDWFWSDDEVVIQIHPRRSEYVNMHPFCLHLWKPTKASLPTPPPIYVGPLNEPSTSG